MKTTINIPDDELKRILKNTRARTKRQAILQAVAEFNRRRQLARLAGMLGTFKDFMTRSDLRKMREEG